VAPRGRAARRAVPARSSGPASTVSASTVSAGTVSAGTVSAGTVSAGTVSASTGPSIAAMPWMQPYPDSLLDQVAADQPGPEAVAVSRETISLAFLAASQLLPARQPAVLILRDVVSLPAPEGSRLPRTALSVV